MMTKHPNKNLGNFFSKIVLASALSVAVVSSVQASPPPPASNTTAPYILTYTAKLTNASNAPITTAQTVRFSLWTDADWDAGDIDGLGDINILSPGYAGWQETYTVTPNADGIFTVELGSNTVLPNFTSSVHAYLEVDVKPSASANTAFEVLDPSGNLADTTDRKSFNSSPYAVNADTVDNRDVGTDPGNIPFLDGTGKLTFGVMPGGTGADTFILDADSNAVSNIVSLQFGGVIAEYLSWNDPASRFDLSDSLQIDGDLSFIGTGNITGATIDGTLNTLINIPNTAIAPYNKIIRLVPEYDGASLQDDGADNNGRMNLQYEDLGGTDRRNYYQWTTGLAAAQDLDINIKYQLPTDFVAFTGTPLTLTMQTQDGTAANNSVDVTMFDSTGTAVALTGGAALTSAGVWSDQSITFAGAPTFTPGTFIIINIKTTAINGGKYVKVGDLQLNYTGR